MVTIRIVEVTLSDGSLAYDVNLEQDGQRVKLEAVTYKDANTFAETLQCGIVQHTGQIATIAYGRDRH